MTIMSNSTNRLIIKPGREKSLRHRHPWIFSGAVERVEGTPEVGDTVSVFAHDGGFLAHAAYCPESQIRARAWSFDPKDTIDEAFLRARLEAAVKRRADLRIGSTGMRLVHGESDGLPGLVADRYGDVVVVQLLSAGAERWREFWGRALAEITGARACTSAPTSRCAASRGCLRASVRSWARRRRSRASRRTASPTRSTWSHGQKTGFYLDQRENRALAAAARARGRRC